MTAKQKTLDLLRAQRNAVDAPAAVERRDRWLAALEDLYEQIHAWVGGTEEPGLIVWKRGPHHIKERYLEEYVAGQVDLVMPSGETVEFVPVGTYILGADGRVDVRGARGAAKLIWDRTVGWSNAIQNRLGAWEMEPLTEETFWALIGGLISAPPS